MDLTLKCPKLVLQERLLEKLAVVPTEMTDCIIRGSRSVECQQLGHDPLVQDRVPERPQPHRHLRLHPPPHPLILTWDNSQYNSWDMSPWYRTGSQRDVNLIPMTYSYSPGITVNCRVFGNICSLYLYDQVRNLNHFCHIIFDKIYSILPYSKTIMLQQGKKLKIDKDKLLGLLYLICNLINLKHQTTTLLNW